MTKKTLFPLFIALLLAACNGKKAQNTEQVANNVAAPISYAWTAEELPNLNVGMADQGVAGGFAVNINGNIVVAGGANFPEKPAAEGGKKRMYDTALMLKDSGEGLAWNTYCTLQSPISYAATAYTGDGLVYMGGNNGNGIVAESWLWVTDRQKLSESNMDMRPMPSCPVAVENAAGAYGDGYIYLVGGQTPEGPSIKAWRMSYPITENASWEELPDLPRSPRVQCSAAWLGGRLYVAGGYNPSDGTVNAALISWAPGEEKWTFVDSVRKPDEVQTWTLVGGTMLADETTNRLLFVGGVDATIFQEAISRPAHLKDAREAGHADIAQKLEQEAAEYMHHEPEWYKFNDQLISYDLATNEYYSELTHPSLARAGAAVLMCDSVIYVVNGELKPGIRSNTAVKLTRRILE